MLKIQKEDQRDSNDCSFKKPCTLTWLTLGPSYNEQFIFYLIPINPKKCAKPLSEQTLVQRQVFLQIFCLFFIIKLEMNLTESDHFLKP